MNSPAACTACQGPVPTGEKKPMFRISTSTLLNSIPITLLVVALTAAQALTPAGPKRPATVPAGYVITPYGYFDPSCVTHLAKGDVVRQDATSSSIRMEPPTTSMCAPIHITKP